MCLIRVLFRVKVFFAVSLLLKIEAFAVLNRFISMPTDLVRLRPHQPLLLLCVIGSQSCKLWTSDFAAVRSKSN